MKSKIFKKLVAGIATLAMAAQFSFVLPASAEKADAEDVYVKTSFADGDAADWTVGTGTLAVASNALTLTGGNESTSATKTFTITKNNPIIYYDFTWNSGVSTGRAGGYTYFKVGDFELRTYGVEKKVDLIAAGKTKTLATDAARENDYTVSITADTVANKLTYSIAWSDSGKEEGKVDLTSGVAYAKMEIGYFKPGRITSSSTTIKSISVREEENTKTFRDVTFDVDGKETTVKVLDGEKLLETDIPSNPLKIGYKFTKWKDSDSNTEYTSEELLNLTIEGANKKFVAQFEEDASMVEKMAAMEIKTHPVQQPELPVKNADGTDTTKTYDVELSITGEMGNELAAEDYPYTKGDLEVTWSIEGFDFLEGTSTGEPTVRDNGDLVYCDSYMTLSGFTGNKTKGTITLASGIKNYLGKFKVSVKYGNETIGYNTLTDEFPLIIMPEKTKPANRVYPLGGYFENLNWYSDSLIGYSALSYNTDNSQNPDPFLSGWCTWGGRTIKEMSLQKDEETGDKYLFATSRTATNSSNFAAFEMGSLGEQAYIDTDIQFSDSGELISLRNKGERNSDDKTEGDAYKDVAYRAIHTAPYKHDIRFSGGKLEYDNENSVSGLEAGKWYRVRISFDDSAQQFWYQVWNIDDTKRLGEAGRIGDSLGKTNPIPYSTALTSLPYVMNYFVLGPTSGADKGIKLKNTTIYKPEMTAFSATTDTETLTIPEGTPVASTNTNSEKNTVKVLAEKTAVTAEVTNKTSESEKINAFVVSYTADNAIAKISMNSTTVAAGAVKSVSVNVPTDANIASQKLFVWTDKMEPLTTPTEFELDSSDKPDPIANLSTIKKDAEGNDLSGNVIWTLAEEYEGVSIAPDSENANNAVVKVTSAAAPGEIYAIAANRGQTARVKITLTGSSDNVAFLNPTTSVTIPFDDTNATVTYNAEVRTGEGTVIEGKTVSYAMYDANNAQPLANTAAVSFDPATATLTVTKDAAGQVVYIRAISTNTDGEAIAKSIKVTIHGLSFDFGASDEEGVHEGYTAVTPDTAYTPEKGYGISGNATAGGSAASDDLNGDYIQGTGDLTFKVNVPEGKNYKLTVTYQGALSTEEVDKYLSGVTRKTNTTLSKESYNVAVIGDSLDFKVGAADGMPAQVASVEIEMLSAKTPGSTPTWFTYGDSTTNSSSGGKVGWANRVQQFTTKFVVNNTAKSGSNPTTFYNGGNMDNILLNIAPGDLVTFNGMGTNSYTELFKSQIQTLIKACRDRGAYVIMTTYTPHGAVAGWANRYDAATQKFSGTRDTDGYTEIYREIAAEDGEVLLDYGKLANDWMNTQVDTASTTDTNVRDAKAKELIAHFLDHNHTDDWIATEFAKLYAPVTEEAYETLVTVTE